MIDHVDYLFKFVLLGDLNVGKTSLIRRFVDDRFEENSTSTIGIDFKVKTVSINGLQVRLQLWDTAGQERYRTITNSYLRGAHAAIIVYDCTNPETSLQTCLDWLRESDNVNVRCIVGSKSDLCDTTNKIGKLMAEKNNALWFEVSSKTDQYVSMMFLTLAERCILTLEKMALVAEKQNIVKVNSKKLTEEKTNIKKCCN
jgi:small GTP-binding protein